MDEFTDYENLDLQNLSDTVLDSFCERYLAEAMRVVSTGIIFSSDEEMIRLSMGIVVGMYFKRLADGIEAGEKVTH